MIGQDCVTFLQEILPRLGLRWSGFRKVRRQVCRRIAQRLQALALPDLATYRTYLESHPAEWSELRAMCRVTISRFYRDRGVFDQLRAKVLPALAEATLSRGDTTLRSWCLACASGEEPYTLNLLWRLTQQLQFPALESTILATDIDPHLLDRARCGCYPASSLKKVPPAWREPTRIYRRQP